MKSESVSGDTPREGENPREDARPSRFRSVEMLPRMASVTSLEKAYSLFRAVCPEHDDSIIQRQFAYVQFQSPATRGWTGTGR